MTVLASSILRGPWPIAVVVVIAGVLLVLFYPDRNPASQMHSAGSTYGRILVDSPEVYTRERMVNDRFRQEAWLLDRLNTLAETSIQGAVEGQRSSTRSAGLSLRQGSKAPAADREPQADGTNTPATAKTRSDPANAAETRHPQLTPVEVFRDRMSYREEVRNAIIENQLDDRHDLGGNTLYRLKFDATVIPGNDTSAWAQIKVRFGRKKAAEEEEEKALRELYQRWMSDLQEQVNAVTREEIRKAAANKNAIYEAGWRILDLSVGDSISGLTIKSSPCRKKLLVRQVGKPDSGPTTVGDFLVPEYSVERYKCMLEVLSESKTDYCDSPSVCEKKIALAGGVVDTLVAAFGSSLGQKAGFRKALEDGNQQPRGRKALAQRYVTFTASDDGTSILVDEFLAEILAVPVELIDSERRAFATMDSLPRILAVPVEPSDSERRAFGTIDSLPTIFAVPAQLDDSERAAFGAAGSLPTILAVPAKLNDTERAAFRANDNVPVDDNEIIETWTNYLDCGESVGIRVAGRDLQICASSLQYFQENAGDRAKAGKRLVIDAQLDADSDGQPIVVPNQSLDDQRILETWTRNMDCEEQVGIRVAGRELKICAASLQYLRDPGNDDDEEKEPIEIATTLEADFDGQPMVVPTQVPDDSRILETWTSYLACEERVAIRVGGRELTICAESLQYLVESPGDARTTDEPIDIDASLAADDDGQPTVVPKMRLDDKRILETWASYLYCGERVGIRVAGRELTICAESLQYLVESPGDARTTDDRIDIDAQLQADSDGQPIVVASTGFQEFRTKLRNSDDNKYLFAYAVTPRESSQQLASSSRLAVAEQFSTSANSDLGGAGVDVGGGRSSRFSEYARIMERRPVVVGVATHANSREQSAEFGWLIGPKLIVGSNGLATYRHLPSQNSLAALVSAPSWWRRADIDIETGWLDDNGEMSGVPDKVEYSIALPGDQEEITSALLLGGRRPAPIVESVEPTSLNVGEPAKILIGGQHLWRSTVVTIGAQRAKRIFVLPNMKGIIAEFDSIESQATRPTAGAASAVLRVWTSEGVARLKAGITINDSQSSR